MTHVVYAFGDFLLDPLTRELRRGSVVENLPVSTVDCLIYLVQHRNRSVGRDELASAVWGRADVSEASLTQAIMRLRRVVGDASCIRTTPRLGYRWAFEPTRERSSEPPPATDSRSTGPAPGPSPTRNTRTAWVAGVSMLVLAASAAWWLSTRTATDRSAAPPDSSTAGPVAVMVLPAGVDAAGEWA